MTAQVVFLNTFYYPSEKEQVRLDFIQNQLELYHAELAFLSRDLNDFQKFLLKERSHNALRKEWRMIAKEVNES